MYFITFYFITRIEKKIVVEKKMSLKQPKSLSSLAFHVVYNTESAISQFRGNFDVPAYRMVYVNGLVNMISDWQAVTSFIEMPGSSPPPHFDIHHRRYIDDDGNSDEEIDFEPRTKHRKICSFASLALRQSDNDSDHLEADVDESDDSESSSDYYYPAEILDGSNSDD